MQEPSTRRDAWSHIKSSKDGINPTIRAVPKEGVLWKWMAVTWGRLGRCAAKEER